jgi:hypothetical protein
VEAVVISRIPPSLSQSKDYEREHGITGVGNILMSRARRTPFNVAATLIFLLAVIHTFFAGPIAKRAHHLGERHGERIIREGRTADAKPYDNARDDVSIASRVLHLLGEVEAVFGIWLVPLMFAVIWFYGYADFAHFIDGKVDFTEPLFVVVIMAIACTRPVIRLAETCMSFISGRIGSSSPASWWITILIVGPLFGSFITEPAAMTICALLLARVFFNLNPSPRLKYATLGLLFVNVSVGGTLTHFAAPPVLMVAGQWGWGMKFMFLHFGWKACVGIVISTLGCYALFRRDFAALKASALLDENYGRSDREESVPAWVSACIVGFLAWTVFTAHHPALFIGGFLFFLAFHSVTETWQSRIEMRNPLMVGFFLAALVVHGNLQQWWIEPVLSTLKPAALFLGSSVMTAFNDNAAITYLASQVPAFASDTALQQAVVYGAVTGGGLTVIANAPNPAGQSILREFFGEGGISPAGLFLGAVVPTLVVGLCFELLPAL